jgi:uncharacterized protein YndB with AHSA1/START domain
VELRATAWMDAPPASVWAQLTDPALLRRLLPWVEEVELPDGPLGPGARVRVTATVLGRRETAEARITAFEPERTLALSTSVPSARARARLEWRLAPERGGTRVDQNVQLEFASTLARMAATAAARGRLSAEGAQQGLDTLKEVVEQGARASAPVTPAEGSGGGERPD